MDRNVVLICLDAVRKEYFDRYAPRLRSAADRSFDQCRAASSWSVPSHGSMLTGALPSEHGSHTHSIDFSSLSRADTFLGQLPEHRALGVSANAFVSSEFAFDALFDVFVDVDPVNRFPDGVDVRGLSGESTLRRVSNLVRRVPGHSHPLKSVGNALLAQLNSLSRESRIPQLFDSGASIVAEQLCSLVESSTEPFFLYGNFMDAHAPLTPLRQFDRRIYTAPADWKSPDHLNAWEINEASDLAPYEDDLRRYRELYAAAIDYLDRRVLDVIGRIDQLTASETTVVVTSDHGENLGFEADDHLFSHVSSLSEALTHVPLLVFNPPSSDWGRQFESEYVSHLDLGGLLATLAGGGRVDSLTRPVVAERIGIGSTNPEFDAETYRYWDRMLRCAYSGNRKFVWDSLGNVREYRLDGNRPCWQTGHATHCSPPAWATDAFETDIREFKRRASDPGAVDIDERTRDRLEDLGYI